MILAAAPLLLCAALWLADKLWPLPLYEVQPADYLPLTGEL